MSATISLTGALFSTIPPTCTITRSSPATILRSWKIVRDEEVDERQHDQDDREDHRGGRGAHAGSASSRITSSEPP